MLNKLQDKFRSDFLSPLKQKFYFGKNLPMALLSGTKLIALDEEKSVATVPFKNLNKNPFQSTYFAVMSMAAELSTAALAMLALKGIDANVALIIVDLRAEFYKKAQDKTTFTCVDFKAFEEALKTLLMDGDTATVNAKTIGKNLAGEEVATFHFTWSFKRRN